MNTSVAIDQFKGYVKTLEGYSTAAFSIALPWMIVRTIPKGGYFVKAGDTSLHFGYIADGMVRSYYLKDGEEITTCLCSESKFASSTASFITQTPSHISIRAIEEATIVQISYHHLQKLKAKDPFWSNFSRIIAEREFLFLENYNTRYARETAEEKYLRLLKEFPGIVNRAPLHYIASFLGIKPETLSRIRRKTSRSIS